MNPLLRVENISKNFTSRKNITRALDEVSFCLEKGKILGVLGPNGAGKTTLLKIISTLIIPDWGKVYLNNIDTQENEEETKSRIGMVLAPERSFYYRLTGRQNISFFADLYGLDAAKKSSRIKELFDILSIDYQNKRFDSYSTGMQQRLSIARALLHDPELLLFDEPTKSLDFPTATILRRFIKEELCKKRGKTIIFTTHHMEEALDFTDLFMILNKGKVIEIGTLEELRSLTDSPKAAIGEIFLKLTGDNK